jgi:uncharacterized protein YkwD
MSKKQLARKIYIAFVVIALAAVLWFVRTPSLVAPVALPSTQLMYLPPASPSFEPTPKTTPHPTPLSVSSQIENKLIALTNAERAKNNLPPLKTTALLMTLARSHSTDMATNNYFSHTDLTGGSPSDRAAKIGIANKLLSDNTYLVGVAENIGLITGGGLTADGVARMQIANWMNSPGHRANILDPRFSEIGIGVSLTGTSYYSTQNFR